MLLVVAALTTSITIYQVIISVLHEKFGFLYVNAINTALIFTFIFGNLPCILSDGPLADVRILNRSVFDAYDFISGNICFVVTALGAAVYVGWVMKNRALDEITNGGKLHGSVYNIWYQFVRFVIPVVILAIFIYGLIPLFS